MIQVRTSSHRKVSFAEDITFKRCKPKENARNHDSRKGYRRSASKRELNSIIQEGLYESKSVEGASEHTLSRKKRNIALRELGAYLKLFHEKNLSRETTYRSDECCLADFIRPTGTTSHISAQLGTAQRDKPHEVGPKPDEIKTNEYLPRLEAPGDDRQLSAKAPNGTDTSDKTLQDIITSGRLGDQETREACESEIDLGREQRLLHEKLDIGNAGEAGESVLRAIQLNFKMQWQQSLDLLVDFEHQSAFNPGLSVCAYYTKAIAKYALKYYDESLKLCRRGLLVSKKLPDATQGACESAFSDLGLQILKDLGQEESNKALFLKSLIHSTHTREPVLVSIIQSGISDAAALKPEEFETALPKLVIDMRKYQLSFGDNQIIVGSLANVFRALQGALNDNNIPLMKILCSNSFYATAFFKNGKDSPIAFDMEEPIPQYAWYSTTLLHVVAGVKSRYSSAMAQLLIHSGANINADYFDCLTPLHICARHNNVEVAETLIKNGAPIEAKSVTGKPPIHFAAYQATWTGDVRILRMLIRAGADINAKNKGGYTALHWCMFDGTCIQPAELLLRTPGIDVNVKNKNKRSVFDVYIEQERVRIEKGFEKRTNFLNLLNSYGLSARRTRSHV